MSQFHCSPLLSDIRGAKWWRMDFHTHTPHSTDYRSTLSETDWLRAHMELGIDAVAVTDHNGGGWIDGLKSAYKTITEEHPQWFRPLIVFPGVEITVSSGHHFLFIFDSSKGSDDILRLLGSINYLGTPGDANGKTEKSIIDCIEAAGDDCLVIPAHVNGAKGIFWDKTIRSGTDPGTSVTLQTDPRMRKAVLEHPAIHVIEASKNDAAVLSDPNDFIEGRKSFAIVYGSDSHELAEIGSRSTWVKMEEASLKGLKVALSDGHHSVAKFDVSNRLGPGPNSPFWISCIEITGTKFIGTRENEELRLNPSFNAIIGGRGTGKSSIIELLRKATKGDADFGSSDSDHSSNFQTLIDEITSGRQATVCVSYSLHGKMFRLKWNAPNSYSLSSFGKNNTEESIENEGDWCERFPITIFSQKQLYSLKDQTAPLLAHVDKSPLVGGFEWKQQWDLLLDDFVQSNSSLNLLKGELSGRAGIKAKISDLKREIKIFESAGHKEVLSNLNLRRTQGRQVDAWLHDFDDLPGEISKLINHYKISPLLLTRQEVQEGEEEEEEEELSEPLNSDKDAPLPTDTEEECETKLEHHSSTVAIKLQEHLDQLSRIRDNIRNELDFWSSHVAESLWNQEKQASEIAYSELIEKLRSEGTLKPEQYGELVTAAMQEQKKLDALELKAIKHKEAQESVVAKFVEIERWRKSITSRRENFLHQIFNPSSTIRAKLIPFGDITDGITKLRRILSREGLANDDFQIIENYLKGSPEDTEEKIRSIKKKLIHLCKTGEDNGELPQLTFRGHFINHLKSRTIEDRANIWTWFPDDLLEISYRRGTGFIPLSKGSPGQVAATVLAFLLSYGEEPIILDQPEDDLDNRLIYDLIVREIQINKLRRQLIIATHNPNIVVNGNADWIIPVMEHEGSAAFWFKGALQSDNIRNAVCEIMEGGKEALERRFRRMLS